MKSTKRLALAALVGCISIAPLTQAQDLVLGNDRSDALDSVSDRERDRESDRERGREHDRERDGAHDGLRLRCGSVGVADTSMRARYAARRKPGRISFGAAFEAAPEGPFEVGDLLDVRLAGVRVGTVMLEQRDDGDLVGSLELHQRADAPDLTTDVSLRRLRVREGTSVVVGPLGCALDR